MFNVIRPPIAPASLAKKTSYREDDVTEALNLMFHGKCYICETKGFRNINVEHFVPHTDDEIKKYDWHNLYFCCSNCNSTKGVCYNNLIDCADAAIDVFRNIKHVAPLSKSPNKIDIIPQNTNTATVETAELISKILNEPNTGIQKISSRNYKKHVWARVSKFQKQLRIYQDTDKTEKQRKKASDKIKQFMKIEQEYSAFLRWIILDDIELRKEFEQYMDEPDYS